MCGAHTSTSRVYLLVRAAFLEFGMTRTILVLCIFLFSVSGGKAECVKKQARELLLCGL